MIGWTVLVVVSLVAATASPVAVDADSDARRAKWNCLLQHEQQVVSSPWVKELPMYQAPLLAASGATAHESSSTRAERLAEALVPSDLLPRPAVVRNRPWWQTLWLNRPQPPPFIGTVEASSHAAIAAGLGLVSFAVVTQCIMPEWAPEGRLRSLLEKWAQSRLQHPLLYTTLCAFFMYASSDTLSQVWTQRWNHAKVRGGVAVSTHRIDLRRCVRSGLISSFLSGFLAVFYFKWLENVFCRPPTFWAEASSWAALGHHGWLVPVLGKVCVDVGCYEPVFDTVYISLQALLRGDLSRADGMRKLRSELAKVLRVWRMAPRYWAFVDVVNFCC